MVLTSLIFSASALAAGPSRQLDSAVVADLLKNSQEVVLVGASNSADCAKPCTVAGYLASHMKAIAAEFEKEKSGETGASGNCAKGRRVPAFEEDLKKAKIALPPEKSTWNCSLKFHFARGETVWSEELHYLKDIKTGQVVPKAFWAFGTP